MQKQRGTKDHPKGPERHKGPIVMWVGLATRIDLQYHTQDAIM